ARLGLALLRGRRRGLLAGGLLGRLALGGGLLGRGLGVDLLGDRVTDRDDRGEAGLLHGVLGGECRGGGDGADDTGGGEGRDTGGLRGGALHPAGTTVLPGGAHERHVEAGPFLPSRLPG